MRRQSPRRATNDRRKIMKRQSRCSSIPHQLINYYRQRTNRVRLLQYSLIKKSNVSASMFCTDTNCDALFLWRTVPKTGHGIHNFKRSTEIAPPASLTHFNLSPRCHRRRELRLSLSSCRAPWNPDTSSTTREFPSFFAWNRGTHAMRNRLTVLLLFTLSRRLAASTLKNFNFNVDNFGIEYCLFVCLIRLFTEEI